MASASSSRSTLFPAEFQRLGQVGFQIVPRVLSKPDCFEAVTELYDIFEQLRPPYHALHFDRANALTHTTERVLHIHSYGEVVHYGAGHFAPVWHVRQHPNVVNVFRRLYGYPEYSDKNDVFQFLSSFEGYSYTPAVEYATVPRREATKRFRIDQGLYRPGCHVSVRGFQALTKSSRCDVTMTVLAGSHRHHAAFVKLFRTQRVSGKRIILKPTEIDWFRAQPGVEEIVLTHEAGDLVLWDARLVYCYKSANNPRRYPRERIGVHVCMKPATLSHFLETGERVDFRDADLHEIIRRKLNFLITRRTTSHDPHHGFVHAAVPSVHLAHDQKELSLPAPFDFSSLSALGQRLAGLYILEPEDEIRVYTTLVTGQSERAPKRIFTETKRNESEPNIVGIGCNPIPPPPPPPPQLEDPPPAKRPRYPETTPPSPPPPPAFAPIFKNLKQRVRPTASKTIVIWNPEPMQH